MPPLIVFPERCHQRIRCEEVNYDVDIIRKTVELLQHISSSLIMRSDVALFLLYQVTNGEVRDATKKYHVFDNNDDYRLQSAARKY
jgi:hypothetical protein